MGSVNFRISLVPAAEEIKTVSAPNEINLAANCLLGCHVTIRWKPAYYSLSNFPSMLREILFTQKWRFLVDSCMTSHFLRISLRFFLLKIIKMCVVTVCCRIFFGMIFLISAFLLAFAYVIQQPRKLFLDRTVPTRVKNKSTES